MTADTAAVHARHLLLAGTARAYGYGGDKPIPADHVCTGCGHHYTCHHGPSGELDCAETGCGCRRFNENANGPDGMSLDGARAVGA